MLEGLPSVFRYTTDLVRRAPHRDSLAVVIYHLLGDVVNAAELALTHYFPLTLTESFLQNSSIGTPYQKWAKFTNEDFQKVDQCLQRLVPAGWNCYWEDHGYPSPGEAATLKVAWHWFHTLNTRYVCCSVRADEPELTLSAVNIDGWVEHGGTGFLLLLNRGRWEPPVDVPPLVTKRTLAISDRGWSAVCSGRAWRGWTNSAAFLPTSPSGCGRTTRWRTSLLPTRGRCRTAGWASAASHEPLDRALCLARARSAKVV
jgi:hypothetical protein